MRSISVRGPGRCDSWARCACRDVHAAAAFVMNGPTTLVRKSLASQWLVGHHRRWLLASGAEPALSVPRPILKGPLAPGHFHAVTASPDTSGWSGSLSPARGSSGIIAGGSWHRGQSPALSAPRPILTGPLAPAHFHAVTASPDTSGSFAVDGPTTTYGSPRTGLSDLARHAPGVKILRDHETVRGCGVGGVPA